MTAWESTERDVELRPAVYPDAAAAGAAAARAVAELVRTALAERGQARLIFAAAPSQEEFLTALRVQPDIDWARVRALHMDEYIGLPDGAPQSFAQWLRDRLPPLHLEPITPGDDAAAEARRYADAVRREPIDVTCLGIGVNGHIAFNEPDQCDFEDPEAVRLITLDETSRQQQVDDECFSALEDVPREALTLTVPALLSASSIIGVVQGEHKAPAVARMMTAPVGPGCPATALRTHPDVEIFLDTPAASLLP
ncbi:glucosamine-6-phosphate deaminase [Phytoactinopolyspora alkaliphila]|uniref:Glucosamine-6-phosphate deaminase n=2 Tax=Phytoactinopolyspora alkaliphila TaxID=1783498 RepID=A0A6N9YKZ7_9ACTN|nr:glucosamine-6-phosphate deaminase [Phytoactinopolyspora alkaliphila]